MSKKKIHGDNSAPFTVYSSSINGEEVLTIENNHIDNYSQNYLEGTIQGQFSKDNVGGWDSNHLELQEKKERYNISYKPNNFNAPDIRVGIEVNLPSVGDAPVDRTMRDPLVKRPFNMKNIEGKNFQNNYEVVTTSGRKSNNRDFYHSGGYAQITASEIPFLAHDRNYLFPQRTKTNKSVISTRFGMGQYKQGSYDFETGEYTPYNSQPWKDKTTRDILNLNNKNISSQNDFLSDIYPFVIFDSFSEKLKVNRNIKWTSKFTLPLGEYETNYENFGSPASAQLLGFFVSPILYNSETVLNYDTDFFSFLNKEKIIASYSDFTESFENILSETIDDLCVSPSKANYNKDTISLFGTDLYVYGVYRSQEIEGYNTTYNLQTSIITNNKFIQLFGINQLTPSYDNGFVTHQIPQNDIQYSWQKYSLEPTSYNGYYNIDRPGTYCTSSDITQQLWTVTAPPDAIVAASNSKAAVSFAGYIIYIVDPVNINTNILGHDFGDYISNYRFIPYVSSLTNTTIKRFLEKNYITTSQKLYSNVLRGCPEFFAALLQHRNGIYGWPSWKQYRTNNSLLRYQKKNSFINNRGILFKESNISLNKVLEHTTQDGEIYKYSYGNLKERFNNDVLETQTYETYNETFYDKIQESKQKFLDSSNKTKKIIFNETVYPNKKNIGIDILRRRDSFLEWWENILEDRRTLSIRSAFEPYSNNSPSTISQWPLDKDVAISIGGDEFSSYDGLNPTGGELQILQTCYFQNIYEVQNPWPITDSTPFISPLYARPGMSGTWNVEEPNIQVLQSSPWQVAEQVGRQPYYENYNQYLEDIRPYTQYKSLIPEFRISEHIEFYLENGGDFYIQNDNLLSVNQSSLSQSSQIGFYETFSLSGDNKLILDLETDKTPRKIELQCEGIVKFLPIKGFYPVERTLHCAKQFSASYEWKYNAQDTSITSLCESARPLYSSLFGPGILFNTIKSGIAVDYFIGKNWEESSPFFITGSDNYTMSGSKWDSPCFDKGIPRMGNLALAGGSNYLAARTPFETILEPESYLQFDIADNEVSPISRLPSCFNSGLERKDLLYNLSINNFLAESINLFLKNGELSSFSTKPQDKIIVDKNKNCYAMILQLRSKPWLDLSDPSEDYWLYEPLFYMFASGSAFGPPVGIYNSSGEDLECTHNYSYFTPPYFEQPEGCTALLKFTPWKTSDYEYSLKEIITNLEIIVQDDYTNIYDPVVGRYIGMPADNTVFAETEYLTSSYGKERHLGTAGKAHNINPIIPGNSWNLVMNLNSCLNMKILEKVKNVEYDPTNNNPIRVSDTIDKDVWIIQTKYETPILNFKNCESSLGDSTWDNKPYYEKIGLGHKGMWFQYSNKLEKEEGVFLQIKDIPLLEGKPQTGSLADLVGFDKKEIKLGEVHDSKYIREAVVAIPYLGTSRLKEKEYFYFDEKLVDFAIAEDSRAPEHIINAAKALKTYVFPPRMNWVENRYKKQNSKTPTNIIKPFKMFVFEFEKEFSSQDLTDIWQNVMPASYKEFSKQKHKIMLDIKDDKDILDNIRDVKWMIFKVKQKAEKNYFAKTADSSDDSRFKFDLKFGNKGRKNFVPEYSYNWPYDYMSIVEFCNIDMKVEFGEDE